MTGGMKHKPLTNIRSEWMEMRGGAQIIQGVEAKWFQRRTGDGILAACVSDEPGIGWHMSISFRDNKGDLSRYPRWDEIVDARETLLPVTLGFVMHLPSLDEYVALHATTFHLHQHPEPLPEGLQ
jgi:hypothetical protein